MFINIFLKSFFERLPLRLQDKITKIKFIDDNDFYSNEDLSTEFSDLDICDLFSNYGIFIIKNNNESYFEIEIVTEDNSVFNYQPEYFYLDKLIDYFNNIEKYITNFDDFSLNYCNSLIDISILILKLNKKKVNDSTIEKLVQKIIQLNIDYYPNLKNNSKIKVGTWLKIPNNMSIPKEFQYKEKRSKDYYIIDKITNIFDENYKKENFKNKYDNLKESFLKTPINDELLTIMCSSLSVSEESDTESVEDETSNDEYQYDNEIEEQELTENIKMNVQPLIEEDEIEEDEIENDNQLSHSNNLVDVDFDILQFLFKDSKKKNGVNHKETQNYLNEIKRRLK